MHKCLNKIKFRQDLTNDWNYLPFGVWNLNKLNTLLPLFLIGSSSRTTIKFRMSSKFSQIQPWTAELAAIDQIKQNLLLT